MHKLVIGDSISLQISAKISSATPKMDETLFYLFGDFELRYLVTRKELEAIVYPRSLTSNAAATPVEIHLPVALDKWLTIQITISGSKIDYSIDGTHQSQNLPDNQALRQSDSTPSFGYGGTNGRPFIGSITDIQIDGP